MLELAAALLQLLGDGRPVAVATSIDVLGSAPHLAGTSMAVTADGRVLGSVSGGCVEQAALAACRALLSGGSASVARYGFGDAAAARAGLACGGELDVLVHRADGAALAAELRAAASGRPAAVGVITGTAGGTGALQVGDLVAALEGAPHERAAARVPEADEIRRVRAAVTARASTGTSGPLEVECGTRTVRVFADVAAPAPRLIVIGATSTTVALSAAAQAVGYAVTVCDHRGAFARADRFPGAEVVVALAHELLSTTAIDDRTAVCLLGHDEDLDPLSVAVALERGAGYVGALGSRATTARRATRLRALGVAEPLIGRLHAPIGLDLGAGTPAEVAVSILAEVLQTRAGTAARSLRDGDGPIHAERPRGERPAAAERVVSAARAPSSTGERTSARSAGQA